MSSFGAGGADSSTNLDSLLAQLQRQSVPDEQPSREQRPQHSFQPHSYYGQPTATESSQLLSSFNRSSASPNLPAAPTPPSQSMPSQHQFSSSLTSQFGNMGAAARPTDDRSNTLLNLLKFSEPTSLAGSQVSNQDTRRSFSSGAPAAQPSSVIHAPSPTAADPTGLLAAMIQGAVHSEPSPAPKSEPAPWNSTSTASDTQQYLLNLLNRPKASSEAEGISASTLTPPSSSFTTEVQKGNMGAQSSVLADQGTATTMPSRTSFDFQPKEFGGKSPKFEASPSAQATPGGSRPSPSLRARDSHTGSPLIKNNSKSTTPSKLGSAPIQILKKPEISAINNENKRPPTDSIPGESPDHTRRKLDRGSSVGKEPSTERPEKKSVSAAMHELAVEADEEARLALARREIDQEEDDTTSEIVKELGKMNSAKSDADFEDHAHAAAQAIQKELGKEENREALEATLRPEVAQAVKDIVDEAANGSATQASEETAKDAANVADSWESEPDEIVVIEEPAADVKVYNFEMKPWISLTLKKDAQYDRPKFSDESIVDIARMKKEFDQMDRKLVTASENFIAYTMAKAGVRIIRQEDGSDGKVFTDSKDRIFSISMSTTTDPKQAAKETIIGTGTSGSVYWVQIRDREKDLLENGDWERNGIVLPPIGTQEGDSHGVLKTRARTSSTHPDFFAIGRGKMINIIFPAVILQKNLFQTGHPRLVDTDRLFKQCSLTINTGKAGKDFAFSHDDSAIVSLDKSGRVKFWDVRDLTAVDRLGLPAHTSLEVKEPLMALNTIVDGEKAWPTSVLLLDKQRPYQKGISLRYMIVGLKQNHTLQLWDLALGKPVQEFNLPHGNESDAACSILYHPPTGMIIVGHPARNSIYLLHLSAPKYTLKNFSQVEYIQRLVAQDSSIPQPGSTAVISGMREISLENLGVLRSLDILETPVNGPPAGDAQPQAHFELYAMHSKGVVCLVIKHGELGWDKDNKVMEPVDAEKAGLVKVRKLVQPQPVPQAAETLTATPSEAAKIRIALRPKEKEAAKEKSPEKTPMQRGPSAQGEGSQSQQRASPIKAVRETAEVKEAEEAAPQSTEKAEKKRRKKDRASASTPSASAAAVVDAPNGLAPQSSLPAAAAVPQPNHVNNASDPRASHLSSPLESVEPMLVKHLNVLQTRITANVNNTIATSMQTLDNSLEKKLKDREASFETRQSKLIEMVSQVLSDNTQQVLAQIVREQFEKSALPLIRDGISTTITEQLSGRVGSSITHALQKELHKAVPTTVAQSFARPEIAKNISDRVVSVVLDQVEDELLKAMNSQMIPAFTQLAAQAAQRVGNDVIRQVEENVGRIEQRGLSDGNKIDQLIALNTKLSHTVSSVVASQSQLRDEVLALRQMVRESERERPSPQGHERDPGYGFGQAHAFPSASNIGSQQQHQYGSSTSQRDPHPFGNIRNDPFRSGPHAEPGSSRQLALTQVPAENSPQFGNQARQQHPPAMSSFAPAAEGRDRAADELLASIANKMRDGVYQDAIVEWLRHETYAETVFRAVLSRYMPQTIVGQLSPLIWLSMLNAVSKDLSFGGGDAGQKQDGANPVTTKLAWIDVLLGAFGERVGDTEHEIREVTPKIMGVVKQRLEQLFLAINNVAPRDPVLKNITNMAGLASRIIDVVRPGVVEVHSPY